MLYKHLHVTFVGVIATLLDSIVVAEFAGYWLHRLLHSDKIPALSRGHLIHHFLIYGPRQPMRAGDYHDATDNRFSVGNGGSNGWRLLQSFSFSAGVRWRYLAFHPSTKSSRYVRYSFGLS
jgi:hypothetical protein